MSIDELLACEGYGTQACRPLPNPTPPPFALAPSLNVPDELFIWHPPDKDHWEFEAGAMVRRHGEARGRITTLENQVAGLEAHCDALVSLTYRLRAENDALTAEKNALHDALTKFTAAEPKAETPLEHNPFREFPRDNRRMGP